MLLCCCCSYYHHLKHLHIHYSSHPRATSPIPSRCYFLFPSCSSRLPLDLFRARIAVFACRLDYYYYLISCLNLLVTLSCSPRAVPTLHSVSILSFIMTNWLFDLSTIELKDNTVIVVLGASGDLAKKKTVCSPQPRNRTAIENTANSINELVPCSLWSRMSLQFHEFRLPVLTCKSFLVPQQVPPQGYQDCRICPDKDGP